MKPPELSTHTGGVLLDRSERGTSVVAYNREEKKDETIRFSG
jgi:hypothetical protein